MAEVDVMPTPVFPAGAYSIESPDAAEVVEVVDLSELANMEVEAAPGEVGETVEVEAEEDAFGEVLVATTPSFVGATMALLLVYWVVGDAAGRRKRVSRRLRKASWKVRPRRWSIGQSRRTRR